MIFVLPCKTLAIEVAYNTSGVYTAVTFNGFDKYKFQTNSNLSNYHYSHRYQTKIQKDLSDTNLTENQKRRKALLTQQALADFKDPKIVAKYRKNDYENLSTAIGFGFGISRLNFNNETQLSTKNLNENNKTIKDGTGLHLQINLTIRGLLTFYYAPAIYMANVLVKNQSTGNITTQKQITPGHTLGFVTRIMPFSKSEGIVLGLGTLFINNTSRPFFTIGLLLE